MSTRTLKLALRLQDLGHAAQPRRDRDVREDPRVILPNRLLLHLADLIRIELSMPMDGKIDKPIAFVLTKADSVCNDQRAPLTYFQMRLTGDDVRHTIVDYINRLV